MPTKLLLICSFLLTVTAAEAQVDIACRGGNHLYIGIDNAVTITAANLNVKQLTVTADGGTITGADGFYTIKCSAPSSAAFIKVWNKGKLVAQKKMDVQRVSDPVVYALGKQQYNKGLISKSDLQQLYALTVKTNVPFFAMIPIQFEYKRMRNGEMLDTYTNNSPEFSDTLKELLRNAAPGDTIVFEHIKCTGADNAGGALATVRLLVQ